MARGSADPEAFPSTRWSRLMADPAAGSVAAREAFEGLALRYWTPIAGYVRARFAKDDEEARDATQEFFLWMLEERLLERADPARGRFRGFIKRCLANFLHDRERRRRTSKRGGDRAFVPLEGAAELAIPDPAGRGPETVLDDLWRRALLEQARDALEAELAARGKTTVFAVFRDYFLSEDDLDYEAVARRYGLTPVDVSNALAFAKRRYRAHLRTAVLETVQADDDLRAELAWLFEEGS